MKFYLYRSKAKIDALYGQIQGSEKKGKLKWKLDLKLVSLERETEIHPEVGNEEKLRTVLQELEARELIGDLDDDKPYIRGIVPMRWGMYADDGLRPSDQGPFVYFGAIHDDILLGMGGSSHHVEGWYGVTATGSRSATPALVQFLLSAVDTGDRPDWFQREEIDEVFSAMALANHYLMKGPVQQLDFVAKVLCRERYCKLKPWEEEIGRGILATPLYVSQVDPMFVDD